MNIQKLCRLYGLSPLQTIVPVQPGTAAQVWRMTTADGAFLVRTLAGRDQGEREWTIFRHLAGQGFTQIPAILPTADGTPSAELDGVWYQLQRYCPGAPPDPGQPGIPRAMARLAAQLEQALAAAFEGTLIEGDAQALSDWDGCLSRCVAYLQTISGTDQSALAISAKIKYTYLACIAQYQSYIEGLLA